jgi:hypothetical protein
MYRIVIVIIIYHRHKPVDLNMLYTKWHSFLFCCYPGLLVVIIISSGLGMRSDDDSKRLLSLCMLVRSW